MTMTTEEILFQNENVIYKFMKNLDLTCASPQAESPNMYRSQCLDKSNELDFYSQNFDIYLLKCSDYVDTNLITNDYIKKLFNVKKIFNVVFFNVWGDVLEHIDPDGYKLSYGVKQYKSLLMPIDIPTTDLNIFKSFYNKEIVNLEEGKFVSWDVANVPHYWKFDSSKINKRFNLLHIDYIN